MAEQAASRAIAIIGLAGRFPGARGLDEFWQNVREGVEILETFSDQDLDTAGVPAELRSRPEYVRRGTPLEHAEYFDAEFFGYSPREAQILDPQQRVFLECAWEALEHAGYGGEAGQRSVGVYAGSSMNSYLIAQLLRNGAVAESAGGYQLMLGNDKDFLCTRVSYKLDLHGPSLAIQTACSTSLVAVEVACRALARGECELALAGGVSLSFPQRSGYLYEEGMILSPDGRCRPFDAEARGIRAGNGAGIVVLKRLADALADGDTIHAVIRGAAINNDGAGKAGFTAPSVDGQVEVIATAQALAGVDPRSIAYVEAHGTGTPLGDPIEIAALTQVFRASTADIGFCRLGSLKANIGHLDAAAGVAGLIKAVLALSHEEIPPLTNFRTANPQLDLARSPFVASASGSPWKRGGTPRRAGVSSFGIGGTNAHVVLEEAPVAAATASARDARLLVVSAKTAAAADTAVTAVGDHLRAHPGASLADVEYTLGVGRKLFAHRRAVVVHSHAHAVEVLADPGHAPVLAGSYDGGARPIVFLFGGQGSQHAGMGSELYRTEPAYAAAFDRCAVAFEPHLGVDLRATLYGAGSDVSIKETQVAQPALFAVEYAIAALWMSRGLAPSAMLGHSIGEYVAAHLAGVFSLEDAAAVVAARGRLMQAMPAGSMAAVQLPAPELAALLGPSSPVEIAAVNAPGLCTISGPGEAITEFGKRLVAMGVDFRPLHTSHAFHSAMMEPALAPFEKLLQRLSLSAPRIPYISNVSGTWITPEQATSPAYYAAHLRHSVQFEPGVRALAADPATLFVEVGPGNALTSLARLTIGKDGARRVFSSLSHPQDRRPEVETILETTGRLWLAGAPIDWTAYYGESHARRIPLPTYPFQRKRHWVDAQPAGAPDRGAPNLRPADGVDEMFFAPTWTRDDARIGAAHLDGGWLVLTAEGPLGAAVARQVAAAGATPITVVPGSNFRRHGATHFSVRPGTAEDIAEVVRSVGADGTRIAGAIHLWSTVPESGNELALTYHSLVGLAAALDAARDGAPVPVIVCTMGAESVLDEAVVFPEGALVRGPVISLPTEVSGLRMRSVDVEPVADATAANATAAALVWEAACGDGENIVAHRGRRRWVRRFERVTLPSPRADALPLKPHGVYLITGGLGGIGVSVARWLASQTSARMLLTARSPMPDRKEWDGWLATHTTDDRTSASIRAIREIEQAGGEVLVAAADAADPVAMKAAIESARKRWGAIDGVVHAAGIAGDGRIAFLGNATSVSAVLAPKMGGLAALVELLGAIPLDFVVLLSSISSRLGAPGLVDYASANAVLDAFVDSTGRPASWRQVTTVNYAQWRDVGMASRIFDGTDAHKKATNDGTRQFSISPAEGVEAFARILASGRHAIVVFPSDVSRLMELVRGHTTGVAATPEDLGAGGDGSDEERPAVSSQYVPPESETERRIADIWSELLGIGRIGMEDDFFELGGHSLLATRVLSRIQHALGARLSLRDVFDAPTVRTLAGKVAAAGGAGAPQSGAPDDDREELDF